jgi:TonB-linked SusC/RagA family outer membrane protein
MNLRLLKKVQSICLGLLLAAAPVFAQNNVSGKVTSSENGAPLAGVQVIVKGSALGTITDTDGTYSLKVSPEDVLDFLYLGYKSQEQPVGTRSVIDVVLENDTYRLDDVVVMGYSSTKKAELTSSVVSLDGKQLTDVVTSDVGNMLQGKVAGVMVYNVSGQPGEAAKMRVRGIGSFSAESTPLYVVDGIPGGSYNPNDIETLTVLKDVGATAIYGASGANGVIVITTKKAKMNQPVKVEFKANAGVKEALFGHFKPMNSEELYDFRKSLYSPVVFQSSYPKWLKDEDFDWMDAGFNLGTVQNYYAAVSGGSEKLNFRVSTDHYREKGTLITTRFNRTGARANLNAKIFRDVDMSVRFDYSESNNSTPYWTLLEGLYRSSPWDYPYDADGNPVLITSGIRPDRPASTPERPTDNNKWWGDSAQNGNVLNNAEYNYSKGQSQSLMADVMLKWNILPWLSISTTNRFSRGMWNSSLFLDPTTKAGAADKGRLEYSEAFNRGFSTSNLLNAGHSFGKHNINGLLGWEWGEGQSNPINLAGVGMPTGMDSFSSSTANKIGGTPKGTPYWGWSAFGQFQYSYMSKYFVTAVFRADNSSNFAPNKRTGYFPAISGAWIVSNENFLKNSDVVTFLKLRASYGQAGNDKIGTFRYLDAFELRYNYLGAIGATPDRLSNQYLHWEVATTFDVGLDINFSDWMEINIDYYDRINSELLMDRPMAPSTGFFSQLDNVGEMRNRGVELQLNSTNWKTDNFRWTTSFNIAYNTNKMTKLIPTDENPEGTFVRTLAALTDSPGQIIENGTNIYTWYMPEWYGVNPENGAPQWYDANGEPTSDYSKAVDRKVGTALPIFYGGLFNSLSYKWFTLDFNFTFNYGNKIYNYMRMYMDADGLESVHNQMSLDNGLGWSRWEEPGDIATHPKASTNAATNSRNKSSRFLEDGSYLRLRNVTLSFNLPQTWLSKMKMSSARIYLSADNVFTLSRFSGMDPEINLDLTSSALPGISRENYPVGRVYSGGIEFSF